MPGGKPEFQSLIEDQQGLDHSNFGERGGGGGEAVIPSGTQRQRRHIF